MIYPNEIFSGFWKGGHCQGIAVDQKNGYMYFSFTTMLVKTDLTGRVIASAKGLLGHLGCIAFCEADGRLYGSLEYKNDSIGKGILKNLGSDAAIEDGFYIAIFDVEKMDRPDMDACSDGVMNAVFLRDVLDDYKTGRYGCSGIDGATFGPLPGDASGKMWLFVAYGIYSDVSREDNDHQVILCYDLQDLKQYERPLRQLDMHKSGPEKPLEKFFAYTGNTTYGVQNLEYDPFQRAYFMAVYRGKKSQFPNYALYALDASIAPQYGPLKGLGENGKLLSQLEKGQKDPNTGLYGWNFPDGSCGLAACGDGRYYITTQATQDGQQCGYISQYVWQEEKPFEKL